MLHNVRRLFLGSFLVACTAQSASPDSAPGASALPPAPSASPDAPGASSLSASSSAGAGAGAGAGADAGPGATDDGAAPANAVASLAAQMPQVTSSGGPVLVSPKTVVISFPGDPQAAVIEPFVAGLPADPYWSAVTSEYGVGPLTVLPPVHLHRTAPATVTDDQVKSILTTALANPANAFGPPDPSTLYALLIPFGTSATGPQGGASCAGGFAGYHGAFALPDGTVIPYAVIVECKLDRLVTGTFTHELVEAVSDPLIKVSPAYNQLSTHDLGFRLGQNQGAELGDMCEPGVRTFDDPLLGQKVARIWSNTAARAGHNPCLPVPAGETFFMTLPTSIPDTVQVTLASGSTTTGSGFALAAGKSRTIELGLMSEGATTPWTVEAHEVDSAKGGDGTPATPRLSFALDKSSGVSGDRLMLTVTALADVTGGAPFAIVSDLDGVKRSWYGVVAAP